MVLLLRLWSDPRNAVTVDPCGARYARIKDCVASLYTRSFAGKSTRLTNVGMYGGVGDGAGDGVGVGLGIGTLAFTIGLLSEISFDQTYETPAR